MHAEAEGPVEQLGARVLMTLRAATGDGGLELARPLERISGGYWAKTYGLVLRDAPVPFRHDLILRVMPDEDLARREIAIQRAVAGQGFPCPAVRLADASSGSIGAPFMIMDRAPGRPLLSDLSFGRAVKMLPKLLTRMPELFAQTLAGLHELDPEPARRALAEAGVLAEVEGAAPLLRRLRSSAAYERVPGFDGIVEWLDEHEPHDGRRVICHGDFHPLNVLAVGFDVEAVIDWTGGRIANPAYDVGFTAVLLGQAPVAVPRPVRPAVAAVGRLLARRFKAEYRKRVDVDSDAVTWYEVLQSARISAEVASWRLGGEITNASHPFETIAAGVGAHLAGITGTTIDMPTRRST